MNVDIEIIDTQDNSHITSDQYAKAASIILGWQGGDTKDGLCVVGSYLKFTLVSLNCEDGVYYDLFTGDETRFKVILRNTDDNTVIWHGFLLPDSYSEPYKDAPIDVSFEAVDGLGRIKGKYLPEAFYEEEKSVIEIISNCLKLTGMDINFRFSPAIENYQQKDYNQIYIDTRDYKEDDKKRDAYDILDELLNDMLLTLYQADNVFNIEGFNVRQLRVYKCKEYDINGTFIEEKEITRLSKKVTALATPEVTMQPPYGVINISHERVPVEFPKTLSKEENDGWVVSDAGLSGIHTIYALDWFGNDGLYAYATQYVPTNYTTFPEDREDLRVYFGRLTGVGDEHIKLRQQPYLKKGEKYKIVLNFKIITEQENLSEVTRQTNVDQGFWTNPFDLKLSLNYEDEDGQHSDILFANYDVDVDGQRYREQDFSVEGVKDNTFEFIPNYSGILSIKINGVEDIGNSIFGIAIEEATIEHLGFEEEYLSQTILNKEYTLKKEMELTYADDSTGESKAFRLQKLRTEGDSNNMPISSSRSYDKDGYTYNVIDLKGANLIKENQAYDSQVDVFYNYLNSQEHVFRIPIGVSESNSIYYDYNAITENRDYWEEWTDAVYKIERIRYCDAVRNVFNRMYDIPVPKLDFTVKNNVKFNDFINFTYRSKNQFILTNCEWDIDKGFTRVTGIESYYAVAAGTNLPPVVEAGNDIPISNGVEQVQLISEGYDPDGFIVSYFWEVLSGEGAIFDNPNDSVVNVSGLTGDEYVFQVTVTDNDGATATDTVTVFRDQNHVFSLEVVSTQANSTKYKVVVTPEIADNAAINFRGRWVLFRDLQPSTSGEAKIQIWINGSSIVNQPPPYPPPNKDYTIAEDFSYTYNKGDVIEIELTASAFSPDIATSKITVDSAEFVQGFGEVSGVPITKEQVAP